MAAIGPIRIGETRLKIRIAMPAMAANTPRAEIKVVVSIFLSPFLKIVS